LIATLVLSAVATGVPRTGAWAADPADFRTFCGSWMQKLREREEHNLRTMKLRSAGSAMVGEYTGYARDPVRCESKKSIGTLVYHEMRYRKAGKNASAALTSKPSVVETIEVMEIFRHDGKRWLY
jgi:hypothetical protein